jgi:histidinol dehydrogenase
VLVRIERRTRAAEQEPRALVKEIRALVPAAPSVTEQVVSIIADVAARGDVAVAQYSERFDGSREPIRVGEAELESALGRLAGDLRAGLEVAITNVAEVAWAGTARDAELTLPQGQRVLLREVPLARAAVYVPGGRAPYPSTVVMGVVTARAAGVTEVVVCTPPPIHDVTLAACAITGVREVYRIGGAQAIAALAHGTETVTAVEVIVGPGNLYVQEAKRLLADRVAIDGFAGPSDLLVIFDTVDPGAIRLIALDLLAQAEHGEASIVLAVAAERELLDALALDLEALAAQRGLASEAACVLVETSSLDTALELADAFAPEHLQLIGAGAEQLAPRVRSAGCVFVGWPSATAFGDYVVGSNHVLPTGGSARFASMLSTRHFRRRMAEVRISHESLPALVAAGVPIARAEGFAMHAESMSARAPGIVENPGG